MDNLSSHTLCLSELRGVEPNEPLIVSKFAPGIGQVVAVATRLRSFRRDVVKLKVCEIMTDEYCVDVVIETADRKLMSEGTKTEYEIRQTRSEKERESAMRVLKRYEEEQ